MHHRDKQTKKGGRNPPLFWNQRLLSQYSSLCCLSQRNSFPDHQIG